MQEISNRVREFREAAGLTQAELAHRAGLTVGAISQIERGENVPKVSTAVAIARVLGSSIDALFLAVEPTEDVGPGAQKNGPRGSTASGTDLLASIPAERSSAGGEVAK